MFYNRYYYRPSILSALIIAPVVITAYLFVGIVWLCWLLVSTTVNLLTEGTNNATNRTTTTAHPAQALTPPSWLWPRRYRHRVTAVASASAFCQSD